MTGTITARNASQKIPTIGINVRKIGPFVFYKCPVGKKAIIKGNANCTNTGASATVDLTVVGESVAEWQATTGRTDQNVPQDMAVGVVFTFEYQLAAGEEIASIQSGGGTNAPMNFNAEVQETPV